MSWHFPWDLKNCAIRHCLPSLQKFTPQKSMNFGKGFLPSAACPKSPWTSFFLLVYPKLTCETVGTMVQSQFAIRRACSKKNLWSCVPRPFIKCCKDKDNITQRPKNTLTTPTYWRRFHERTWIIRTPRCILTQPDGWNFVLLGAGSSSKTSSSPWTWLEAAGAGSVEEDDEEELEELDLGFESLATDADDDGRFGGDGGGVTCTSTSAGPCESGRSSSATNAIDAPAETSELTTVVSRSRAASSSASPWLSWLPSCLFILLTSSETVFNLSRLFVRKVGKAALALGLALALAFDLAEAFALALACRFAFAAAWQPRLFFERKKLKTTNQSVFCVTPWHP